MTPAIVENCFSSGVATDAAIVSGLAPGRLAFTWIVGKSTVGQVADRQQPVAHDAEDQDREDEQRRRDGPADEWFGDVHGPCSRLPAAADLAARAARQVTALRHAGARA